MVLAAMISSSVIYAQSVIVVDSEQIFRSLDSYNSALAEVDKLSKDYQAQVDAKFDEVEALYNYYVAHKAGYSATTRQNREAEILAKESAATKFQEEAFSQDGTIMKRRLELITPIQDRVFKAIEEYAKSHGADIVIDKSSNPSLLYGSSEVNHTQGVIEALK